MKILDRYVLIRYLKSFFWSILSAVIIFLVVNIVEQMDRFIDGNVDLILIARFYYLYIPYIIYLVLPVSTLLATLFTIGGMSSTNELSAMHVSGVPFSRPLIILLSAASMIAVGGFVLGESVIPGANRERMDIWRYDVKKLSRETQTRLGKLYLQISPGRHLHLDHYDSITREAFGISISQTDYGTITERIDAEKMVWRDKQWHLQGAIQQRFHSDGSIAWSRDIGMSIAGKGYRPDELESIQTVPEEMNWRELRDFIQQLKTAGSMSRKWEVEKLFKVSLPVAAIIIVLFGAPVAAMKRRGGTALGFGLSLFICFIYFGFIQVGKVLGYNGTLPPIVSAWIGNVFFGILGLGVLGKSST